MPLQPFPPAGIEAIFHAAVGQLGDHQQPAIDHLDAFQRQQERMPHAANPVQRTHFVRGPLLVLLAENELDRFGQPAGGLGPPYFAVSAGTNVLDQAVSGQRLDVDVNVVGHG